jgi:predicted dehydrogenase
MITVGVVGFGYWGPNVARNWNQNRRAKLKFICDIKEDRLSVARLAYPSVIVAKDYHELLKDPEIDAISIVTPIESHYQIAKDALLREKHVLVEKPLTASVKQIEELIDIAERKRKILMVGHTFLYSPPVIKIKELISNNVIGDIEFIQLTRINLGRVKHDFNVIWDLAPHDFSILYYWLNKLPQTIQVVGKATCFETICDIAFITLKYADNCLVNVHLSWISPIKLRQCYIVGKKQMIIYDDNHPTEKVKIYDSGIDIKEPETFGEFQLSYRAGDIYVPRLDAVEPLFAEIDHFIDCIEKNAPPRTDGQHALQIVKMIEAAQDSLKSGGQVINLS